MHHRTSTRRVALAIVIAGATAGALPAMASAASSSCVYSPTSKHITVTQAGSVPYLEVLQSGENIAVRDFGGPTKVCTNNVDFFTVAATIKNTDNITINATNTTQPLLFTLPQLGPGATTETDGVSEIETMINTKNTHASIQFNGSPGPDGIRIGREGINFGLDVYASDNDVDVRMTARPVQISVSGGAGNDGISGRGNFANPQPSDVQLVLNGGTGNDFVEGGLGSDTLIGGGDDDVAGEDRLFSDDGGVLDRLFGGPGFDTATTDAVEGSVNSIEQRTAAAPGI